MINFLVKLNENEKRILIIAFLLLIVVFFLVGLIYEGLKNFVTKQGKDVGRLMGPIVESGYITSHQQFRKLAFKKSRIEFYREFYKTFLAMVVWFLLYGAISLIYGHWLNIFDQSNEGIATLFYKFDWENSPRSVFFGLSLISDWPPVLHRPVFKVAAIPSYILFLAGLIMVIIAFIQILSYASRTLFIIRNSKKMFTKDIEDYKLDDVSAAPLDLQQSGLNKPEKPVKQAIAKEEQPVK